MGRGRHDAAGAQDARRHRGDSRAGRRPGCAQDLARVATGGGRRDPARRGDREPRAAVHVASSEPQFVHTALALMALFIGGFAAYAAWASTAYHAGAALGWLVLGA